MNTFQSMYTFTLGLGNIIGNLDSSTLTFIVGGFVLSVLLIIVVFYYENTTVVRSELELHLKGLPESFDGLVVVHLSDLHNNLHGERQQKIMKHILAAKPEVIFFTGDLIDSRYRGEAHAFTLLDEIAASKVAPLWYVPGNHEMRTPARYQLVQEKLKVLGMNCLKDQAVVWTRGSETVNLVGVDDPMKYKKSGVMDYRASFDQKLNQVLKGTNGYTIVLSHRPDLMSLYAAAGIDLVFSGHAHGGQVRLPGIKGVYAPQQGFFPKFTAGAYFEGDTTMVVSRGLGNNLAPTRFLNRAEVLVVTLKVSMN